MPDVTKSTLDVDVVIIGAGFGGSLTALLCQRIGLRPVLIERGEHPRFTIGESSTPLANLILADLAKRYDLPRLSPLTKYGSWRQTYPEINCGLKRGFSYFNHRAGELFVPQADHANELLVAASPNDELGDTHWYRADVDHFFVKEVQAAGIPYFDRTHIKEIHEGQRWRITAERDGEPSGKPTSKLAMPVLPVQPVEITSALVVDASGAGGALCTALGLNDNPSGIRTNSRTVYGHFENVHLWSRLQGSTDHHPFCCDAAALHHVFDGGWMWVLRFDTGNTDLPGGITSAGFVVDGTRDILGRDWDTVSADDVWASLLRRFPSIARQFADAVPVRPLTKTTGKTGPASRLYRLPSRQQRLCSRLAGPNWAMLPYTAGFVDPLHSPGNAFTLLGIERLIRILSGPRKDRPRRLAEYEQALRRDVALIDLIIHGCFVSFAHFELMSTFSMFYFAGAHMSEHRRRTGIARSDDGFLLSHDGDFVEAVRRGYARVCALVEAGQVGKDDVAAFRREMAELIAPYNLAGLCDPAKCNMYACY